MGHNTAVICGLHLTKMKQLDGFNPFDTIGVSATPSSPWDP